MFKNRYYFFFLTLFFAACSSSVQKPKYVFYFIGDGMGFSQVEAARFYSDSVLSDTAALAFTRFPISSSVRTFAANRYITGSAAAGTALSTGSKTSIGTLGLNQNHSDTLWSIAREFLNANKKVGIITSVSIDHATPAAFYAHVPVRNMYYSIGQQLFSSGYHFFGSGGFLDPMGKRLDTIVRPLYDIAAEKGYAITSSFSNIDSILSSGARSVIFSAPNPAGGSSLQYEIDRTDSDVSLADITRKAIEVLDNPKGFFMMVEGGKIDWACHANDAATVIHEVRAFGSAVEVALEFYRKHPDETLIVVTADHETGGMSLGNRSNHYTNHLALLSGQTVSREKLHTILLGLRSAAPRASFIRVLDTLGKYTGLQLAALSTIERDMLFKAYKTMFGSSVASQQTIYGETDELARLAITILNRKAAIGWTTSSHSAEPVPVFAIGSGSNLFLKQLDNTDIPRLIRLAAGL